MALSWFKSKHVMKAAQADNMLLDIKVKNAMTGDTCTIPVSKLTSVSEVKDLVKEK